MNWSTFRTRSLTAAVFVAVMLTGLLWNHWSFFILFSIVHAGCWIEYQLLMGKIEPAYSHITWIHRVGVIFAGWAMMLYATNDHFNIAGLSLHSLGWWMALILVFLLPVSELLFSREVMLRDIRISALGLLYISLSWTLMIDLRCRYMDAFGEAQTSWDRGLLIPIGMIVSIWINDTMAYVVGSLIGKTPFSRISPKKTWEGTIGGIILAVAVVALLWYLIPAAQVYALPHWLAIALLSAVVGTAGDLLESSIKRQAQVKDSGTLMPGHGGFLDRFDSLLLATPAVWLYTSLFLPVP